MYSIHTTYKFGKLFLHLWLTKLLPLQIIINYVKNFLIDINKQVDAVDDVILLLVVQVQRKLGSKLFSVDT
ncbi:hypothetical protein BLOT_009200 [Blomia tropicalis]|nr:hypothetical protein BLOT_009200 [Blomia tropicalis]